MLQLAGQRVTVFHLIAMLLVMGIGLNYSLFFDRPEDEWPRRWAEAYVAFCAGEKRAWLHEQGMRWLPNPGWPERGGYLADGHGNSVPRFHITWGTGPGVVAPFERRVREAAARGLVDMRFRHRVDELVTTDGAVTGVNGVAYLAAAGPLEDLLGLPAAWLRGAGAVLLAFAAGIGIVERILQSEPGAEHQAGLGPGELPGDRTQALDAALDLRLRFLFTAVRGGGTGDLAA